MEQLLGAAIEAIVRLDAAVVDIVLRLRGPIVTKVLTSVAGLGSATAALVFLGVFYLAEWREEFVLAAGTLAISGALVGVLMATVQRPFPPQPVCLTASTESVASSFPSGHAAAATGFALVAHRSRQLPTVPVAVLAVLVAVSRVYLGTHYFSDTVVGILIALAAFVAVSNAVAARGGATALAPGSD
jgi:undecaprenyl-diphosphatase